MFGRTAESQRKVLWQELWRHEFEEALRDKPVVILPTGSVEQHGPHCSPDVDVACPFLMALETAERIASFPTIVVPPIWSGFAHYNMGFPGTISLRLETYQALLADVLRSVFANGFPRIVVLNGHGGNSAPNRAVIVKLSQEDIFPIAFNYWDTVTEEMNLWSEADESVGHAGEWETSLQLYLRPRLVDSSRLVADNFPNPYSPNLRPFAEYAERCRDTVNGTGVMGDPKAATADKGERLFSAIVGKLVQLVTEMHELPVRRFREFGSHCLYETREG